MAGPNLTRLPGRHAARAAAVYLARHAGREWRGSGLHRWLITHPRPQGLAANPHDPRPADPENGHRILAGAFVLADATMTPGPRGDPWDRASPDARFAAALHGFGWMRDLVAVGEAGCAEGLRLTLEWRRTFGRWNGFSWSSDILERRVFNLACAARALTAKASDAEIALLAGDLARQGRYLLAVREGPARAAERATAAAVAGAALSGKAGAGLLAKALAQLVRALPHTVAPDGGHTTRSPQAALELLFDLLTLDDALTQGGVPAPEEVSRAIDRLCAAVRFFTLADGRLAAFQGGTELSAAYVAAIRAREEVAERPIATACNGYQRLEAGSLQVLADAAAPAQGAWSVAACGQPLAIEVLAGGRRMIVNSGWSPQAHAPQATRLVDAASTAALGDQACGEPLRGFPAQVLGPRLVDAQAPTAAQRHEVPGALWLELSHDGWVARLGLRHERKLYIDAGADELRGVDQFSVATPPSGEEGRRFIPFVVRFHLHPDVSALVARDGRSVLLKAEGEETGWWLRNDAPDVAIEPSVHYQGGEPRRAQQIVLRGQARADSGARVRWKLSAAGGRVDGESGPA